MLAELQQTSEDHVAWRAGRRYVARLCARPLPVAASALGLRADANYLITGGLGGLGLRLARWLVDHGARHLTLVGRRPPSDAAAAILAGLEQAGAVVATHAVDVACATDISALLSQMQNLPPLAGVFHAAGVLDDGVLLRLDAQRFATVLAAKVAGAWHLHEATRALPLDFFVLFSSASALLGLSGQANYAAANAFLDALAQRRRSEGLPALSLNWGPWDEVGMAARGEGRRWQALGLTPLAPERGLELLGLLLRENATQVAILPGDWPSRVDELGFGRSSLLAELARSEPKVVRSDLLRRVQSAPGADQPGLLTALLRAEVGRLLGSTAPLDSRRGFFDLGLDSLMAVELRNRLQARLELNPTLPASLIFDHPTIEALATYLANRFAPTAPSATPVTIREIREDEPIAVLGLGCRFPGADGPRAFWRLLANGVDAVGEVPGGRWDMTALYDPDPDALGKIYNRWGGFLSEVDQFDAAFFGIAPREAVSLDPQQRLLLEVAWEALENAGVAPDGLAGSATGVFVGIGSSDYGQLLTMSGDAARIDPYYGTGNTLSAAAGRLSYVLGLRGPSLAVDTACSSSLVAVHLACQSLRRGECATALAAGVNLLLSPVASVNLCRARMLAHDAHCKTFDASADGYVRGEGCGVVVLKRLSDVADCDTVLALIRGSAVNQDGRSTGLTAPNGPSQEAVIRAALASGGVDPASVSYVEAHGTGTPLGDPIEIQAIAAALGERSRPLLVGSVKTNLGHLEAAAGIAGLIKVVLALRHGQIPAHLHFEKPNPFIPWADLPVAVPTTLIPWVADGPRRAGVSSFGFVGTNAHVVLEEAPALPATVGDVSLQLLTLSARDEKALKALAIRWQDHLQEEDPPALADLAFTANRGRALFNPRLALLADSTDQARRLLAAFVEGRSAPGLFVGLADAPETSPTHPTALLEEQAAPTKLETLARQFVRGTAIDWQASAGPQPCHKVDAPTYPFQRQRFWLEEPATPTPRPISSATPLGRRLRSAGKERVYESVWGTKSFPVLSDHRLFSTVVVPGAWHLALLLEAARQDIADNCELNSVTFREALVLADGAEQTAQLVLGPEEDGVRTWQIFSQAADTGAAETPWKVHAEGRLLAAGAKTDEVRSRQQHCPQRWERDDFYRTLASVGIELGSAFRWLDEIWTGDGEALARMRRLDPATGSLPAGLIDACFQLVAAILLRDEAQAFVPVGIESLTYHGTGGGALWCHAGLRPGVADAKTILADVVLYEDSGRAVARFEGLQARRAAAHTLLRTSAVADWLYELRWQTAVLPALTDDVGAAGAWLVLADRAGFGTRLAEGLRGRGGVCALAYAGTEFTKREDVWILDPTSPTDMTRLLAEVRAAVPQPLRGVLHLWHLDELADGLGAAQLGCQSALHLTQALTRAGEAPRMWLMTRGAVPADVVSVSAPFQALVWGLGRTIALEHPELRCTLLDLDPTSGPPAAEELLAEFLVPDAEQQIAQRNGARLVARLMRKPAAAEAPPGSPAGGRYCRPEAQYLVTGGLGALGLRVARWLAGRGARHLVLLGRRGPSPVAEAAIRDLEQRGVRVQVHQIDVADLDALRRVVGEIPDLRGIIHAAGVLDDGVLAEQTWQRCAVVIAPKAKGAWHLHQLTQTLPLDFFVLYSSAAALLGSPGQASYAAANAFLDALAHHRRAMGLPALSINWGPWDEGGMASRVNDRQRQRWDDQGMGAIPADRGDELLGQLLGGDAIQAGVLPIFWPRFLRTFTGLAEPSWLSVLAREAGIDSASPKAGPSEFLRRYRATPEEERHDLLVQFLLERTAEVLRLAPGRTPGPRSRFFEVGMDSLMAIELRNRLQATFGCLLPSTLGFDHPTAEAMAAYLAATVLSEPLATDGAPIHLATARIPDMLDRDLDGLTEAEVEGLLEQKLASLETRQAP